MKKFKKLFFFVSVLFFLTGNMAFAATNDYINYWSLDEGSGRSANDSVGGQNGILTGTSTGFGWVSGKVGTALAMDGVSGEAIVLPDGAIKGSQGTLSVWFRLDTLSDSNIILSGKSTTDNNIYAALAVDHEGRPLFQSRVTTSGNDRKAQGAQLLNKNEWYNLVFTTNGLKYFMYVNGEEITVAGENIGRWFPDMTNQTLSYRIGASVATPMTGVFSGTLDEVKLYNRALSLDEVKALYEEGNNGVPTTPLDQRPTLSFSISSDRVPFKGSVTLNWSAEKVDSCVASGSWDGSVALSGTKTFTQLSGDQSYTLKCTGKGGNVESTTRVFVATSSTAAIPPPTGTLTVESIPLAPPSSATAVSVANTQSVVSGSDASRRAQIQELIKQILLLIVELQKQLAAMKAAQTTGVSVSTAAY